MSEVAASMLAKGGGGPLTGGWIAFLALIVVCMPASIYLSRRRK